MQEDITEGRNDAGGYYKRLGAQRGHYKREGWCGRTFIDGKDDAGGHYRRDG